MLIPKIKKARRIRDKATNTYVEEIKFRRSDGRVGTLQLTPSNVHDENNLEDALRDAGAVLPKERNELKKLLAGVAESNAPEHVYEAQVGWIEDGKAYVKTDGVIGEPSEKVIGVKPLIVEECGNLSQSGNWQAWRDTVATLAANSSIMMFAICAALAGPLLFFVERQSVSFCIFGRTRLGKSIATLMGASVQGIGRIIDMINWHITDTHMEQRLPEYNDGFCPIEDFQTMEGSERQKYVRIRSLAYRLCQGRAKGVDHFFAETHGGHRRPRRCIMFTSFERSIRSLAKRAKLEREPGEVLRLIDVPARFGGQSHIFDRLAGDVEQFAQWRENRFKEIAEACRDNHGSALHRYIELLIPRRSEIKAYVERWTAHFVDHVCEELDGDIARDVARTFGLIFAAGMLGIELGLLPWSKEELLAAISRCYRGSRGLLPDKGVALRRGIRALELRLRSLPSLAKLPKGTDYERLHGYRAREPDFYHCIIEREAFNKIFASTSDCDIVLEWLLLKGRITTAVSRKATPALSPQPKEQFDWPDGRRRRSFEIRWPRIVRKAGKAASKKEREQ
jgi:hypothetical protein